MAKRKTTSKRKQPVYMVRKYKGRGLMDMRKAPDWWLSSPQEVEDCLRSLKGVDVFSIGESAGGRPILAAAFGEREHVKGRTSVSIASAIAGGDPSAFYGEKRRERQTFLFLGAAHGTEFEGTVGMVNALNVAVKGRDLRGRRWKRLGEALRQQRIIVIPFLNIDGRARYADIRTHVNVLPEDYQVISQGMMKDGTRLTWPTSKLTTPLPVDKMAVMGSYFNDNGVNLVYDNGIGGDCQPETAALVRLLKDEMPDCVLCSHTDNGSLVQPPTSFVPAHFRQRVIQIGAVAGARCAAEGFVKHRIPERTDNYCGEIFYQTDMIYQVCGALPLLVEYPCGYQNLPDTHEAVADICMTVIEEIVAFGNTYGYRPTDPTWK